MAHGKVEDCVSYTFNDLSIVPGSMRRYAGSENYQPPAEGDERHMPLTGSVGSRIIEYRGYVQKGLYYAGCGSIMELHEKATFCQVTEAGVNEAGVRGRIKE